VDPVVEGSPVPEGDEHEGSDEGDGDIKRGLIEQPLDQLAGHEATPSSAADNSSYGEA
jgi:hypothetical protein